MEYNVPAHMNTIINLQVYIRKENMKKCTLVSKLKHSYSLYGIPAPPSTQISPKL